MSCGWNVPGKWVFCWFWLFVCVTKFFNTDFKISFTNVRMSKTANAFVNHMWGVGVGIFEFEKGFYIYIYILCVFAKSWRNRISFGCNCSISWWMSCYKHHSVAAERVFKVSDDFIYDLTGYPALNERLFDRFNFSFPVSGNLFCTVWGTPDSITFPSLWNGWFPMDLYFPWFFVDFCGKFS